MLLKRNVFFFLVSSFFLALTQTAGADEAAIRKLLNERLPNMPIVSLEKSKFSGLYEVFNGESLLYIDEKATLALIGDLIDLQTRKNLSKEKLDRLLAVKFEELPLDQAFKVVRGNGKRQVASFEDPNCGYCKRLAKEFAKMDNVTVHTFLLPVLGPASVELSTQIWCAPDRAKAWSDWMLNAKAPSKKASCDSSALRRNLALGEKLRINGTPALIFASGERVAGYIAQDAIEAKLEAKPETKPEAKSDAKPGK